MSKWKGGVGEGGGEEGSALPADHAYVRGWNGIGVVGSREIEREMVHTHALCAKS